CNISILNDYFCHQILKRFFRIQIYIKSARFYTGRIKKQGRRADFRPLLRAHADHFSPRRSCIHVFDDRIEFLNPGGMPMPLEVMENSFESQPRNPVIAKLFRLAHISENLGYGLRKLKRWQDVTGRPMYIETTINSVKVTFDLQTRGANVAKNVAKNLTDRQQQIIALITDNPQTTRAEIANALGVATKTIERELAAISDIIRYVGSKKGGHWEILNNIQN
ncbi:MAG: ATP-binding protein, partial [Lepagella sp.]